MRQPNDDHMIEMVSAESTARGERVNLNTFFANVESANYMLNELERLQVNLEASHVQSKMVLLNSNVGKGLRSSMDEYFYIALETAKVLKLQLDALHRSNQSLPDCRLGSVMDQTRNSAIKCLREKLVASMNSYNAMRQKISSEYREAVQRTYYIVSAENPDEKTLNSLISTGVGETFLQKARQEQETRSQVLATVHDLDTFKEFRERHDAVKHIEKNLQELHQVYLDMALLVESQGEQLRNESDEPTQRKTPATELRGLNNGKKKLMRGVESYRKNIRKWIAYDYVVAADCVGLLCQGEAMEQ